MRYGVVVRGLALAVTTVLLVTGCSGDDDDGPDGQEASESPAPTAADGSGSALLDFAGDVDGEFTLAGMTCDNFGQADAVTNISISGEVDGQGYTLDIINLDPDPVTLTVVRSGDDYGKWENYQFGSDGNELIDGAGTVTVIGSGGEIEATVTAAAVDPGSASDSIAISGSWTCPE